MSVLLHFGGHQETSECTVAILRALLGTSVDM